MHTNEDHRTQSPIGATVDRGHPSPFLEELQFAEEGDALAVVADRVWRESPLGDLQDIQRLDEELTAESYDETDEIEAIEGEWGEAEEEELSDAFVSSEVGDLETDEEDLVCEGEIFDAEAWTGSDEQIAFRDRVLNAHIARSRKRRGAPKRDLSRDELDFIPGTDIQTGRETAQAAGRLLAAANADLEKAWQAGHVDALRTIRLTVSSGYRSAQRQRELWLGYFGDYYNSTRAAREKLADGPHLDQAVEYMLKPLKSGGFGLGGRIAAPGYSNHQNGIAIDFLQERKEGDRIRNKSGEKDRDRWRNSWFHGWLRKHAATFGFQPIPTEEWHWEYRGGAAAAAPGVHDVAGHGATRPASELVRFAQRVLNATEGERLAEDGDLGRLTRGALERFRAKYGLGAGDVLDAKTELALAQRALEELAQASMFAQAGRRDARTDAALTAFKTARGLGFDPTLDAATRRALTDALARAAIRPRAAGETLRAGPPATSARSVSNYLGGKLWTFTAKTLPTRVAVFCPRAALAQSEVEVLFYAHGLLGGCPRPRSIPDGLVTDAPFRLGRIVDASKRAIVLVVPYLDWANPGGARAFGKGRDRWHALAKPESLNRLVAEVLAELGRVQGAAAPSLRRLIIVGHSRAYDFLEPLAYSHADAQMRQGALARLSQVWAFDTTYAGVVARWLKWLDSNPSLRVSLFYVPGSKTGTIGDKFYRERGPRLAVTHATEGHCAMPARRLPALLEPKGRLDQETDDLLLPDGLARDLENEALPDSADDASDAEDAYDDGIDEAFQGSADIDGESLQAIGEEDFSTEEHWSAETFEAESDRDHFHDESDETEESFEGGPVHESEPFGLSDESAREEDRFLDEPEFGETGAESGSSEDANGDEAEFEFEDEESAEGFVEEEASGKSPLPVPPENPIPFADVPPAGSYWPVRSSRKVVRTVSYMYQAPSGIVGKAGRLFLAGRTGTRNGRKAARWHVGIDLFANIGDVVVACEAGRIVEFGFFYKAKSGQRTYRLLVEHDHSGIVANYGEVTSDSLAKSGLRIGVRVAAGQPIGFVSDTSMLHFETYTRGARTTHRWWKENKVPPPELLNPTRYLLFLWEHGLPVSGQAGAQPGGAGAKPASGAAESSADSVRFAQRVLNATEGERLADDGHLGKLTGGALERFRSRYGLGSGGVLDGATELALAQRALEEIAQQSMFPRFGVLDAATEQALSEFKGQRGLGFLPALDAATRAAITDALARRAVSSTPRALATPAGTGAASGLPKLGEGTVPPSETAAYRKFRLTTYHVVDQNDFPTGPVRVPIFDDQGRRLAEGSPAFFAHLSLEGTARLTDGRLINVTGKTVRVSHDDYDEVLAYHTQAYAKRDSERRAEGKAPTSTRYSGVIVENGRVMRAFAFHEVPASRRGVGYGVQRGIPLVPFRTLAADIGIVKYANAEPKWKGKGGLVPPGTHVYIKEYDGLRLPDDGTHDGWFIVNDTGGGIFGVHLDVFVGSRALRRRVKLPDFGQVWFDGIEHRIPPGYTYGLKA